MITVNWTMGVIEWVDSELRKNTETTANHIKDLVFELKKNNYSNFQELEFIGHGAGAHVAGMGMT